VPNVEVKGERGHYLFLVQGVESGGCTARMIHMANQINGAAALATLNALIREKVPPSSGMITNLLNAQPMSAWICTNAIVRL